MKKSIVIIAAAVALTVGYLAIKALPRTHAPLGIMPTPGQPYDRVICDGDAVTEWAESVIYDAFDGADGVELGDVDEDGRPDVVTPWEQGAAITVSFHPGYAAAFSGAWPTATLATSFTGAEGACFGDFDDDGHLDVVGVSQQGAVRMCFNPLPADPRTGGNWTCVTLTNAGGLSKGWMQCKPGDVNEDGRDDLILGGVSAAQPGALARMFQPASNPRGTWAAAALTEIIVTGRVMGLSTGQLVGAVNVPNDFNGDGHLDILATDREAATGGTPGAFWLAGDGLGGFTRNNIQVGSGSVRMMFEIGDLDDDGDAYDFCTGVDSAPWSMQCFYFSPGAKWRNRALPPPGNTGVFQSSAFGDFDLDGYPDALVTFDSTTVPGASAIIMLSGPFNPWMGRYRHEVDLTGIKTDNAKPYDLDNDGDLDIVDTEQNFGGTGTGLGLRALRNPCITI